MMAAFARNRGDPSPPYFRRRSIEGRSCGSILVQGARLLHGLTDSDHADEMIPAATLY